MTTTTPIHETTTTAKAVIPTTHHILHSHVVKILAISLGVVSAAFIGAVIWIIILKKKGRGSTETRSRDRGHYIEINIFNSDSKSQVV